MKRIELVELAAFATNAKDYDTVKQATQAIGVLDGITPSREAYAPINAEVKVKALELSQGSLVDKLSLYRTGKVEEA